MNIRSYFLKAAENLLGYQIIGWETLGFSGFRFRIEFPDIRYSPDIEYSVLTFNKIIINK
jgi:hypothetical protein